MSGGCGYQREQIGSHRIDLQIRRLLLAVFQSGCGYVRTQSACSFLCNNYVRGVSASEDVWPIHVLVDIKWEYKVSVTPEPLQLFSVTAIAHSKKTLTAIAQKTAHRGG